MSGILSVPMRPDNDAGVATVGEYLIGLLGALWSDSGEFSGKRPYGSSGWDYEIFAALVIAGKISGTFDQWGHLDEVDSIEGRRLVTEAIRSLL